MQNNLFNQTLLKKYSQKFKPTHKQKETIGEYIKKVEKGEFEGETKNYINFFDMILKDVLGYSRDNIDSDSKVDDGPGRVEFALQKDNSDRFMVVELKGQKVDLDKKQTRQSDTRTPFDQALGYAAHIKTAKWILLSNYDEFRLYNYKKKTDYISFNAADLSNIETLKCFMLVFSKKSHLETDYIDRIMQETLVVERKLESEFYKLYNETRLMLTKELEHFNDFDRVKAVHYAQLILNRYMFICFAEDQDLLPSQITIDTINRPIRFKDLRGDEIWHRINGLFRDVREGNKERKVFPYDGVLFDEDLKAIEIRDLIDDHKFFEDTYQKWKFEEYEINIEGLISPYSDKINPIYKNFLIISSFDFSSDLDVNILGHIFENSIGDLEELKADAKGRRKKEGVFYTPEYITDYICRNTIIPYLSKTGKANTVKALIGEYWGSEIEKLDEKVKEIKIVDPACGSGAFLNKAADVLLEVHESIHQQKYKDKQNLMPFFDNISKRREILLNNIFGVDINEESVEITKLSLFLKVSRKDLKLPNLDNNVKCGNSVIDDLNYAGTKAFSWKDSFKDIFDNGGFDIVIGNPPYGRNVFSKEEKEFFRKVEKVQFKSGDSAEIFSKKCFDNLLKPNGILGFIIPKKLLYGEPWEDLRVNYLKKYDLKFILDTSKSFTDVLLEAAAFGLRKIEDQNSNVVLSILTKDNSINEFSIIEKEQIFLENNTIQIYKMLYPDLFEKIYSNSLFGKVNVDMGFYIPKKLFSDEKTENMLLKGIDIDKWVIKSHRYLKNKDEVKWDEAKRFLRPKVVCQRIIAHIENPHPHIKITACYDEEGILITHTLTSFELEDGLREKFLLGYLNSKFASWYAYNFIYSQAIRTMEIYDFYIEQLPIPLKAFGGSIQELFVEEVEKMLKLNKELFKETTSFKDWLKHTFHVDKFSKKLDKYYELSLDDFLAELKKKKVDTQSRKNYTHLKEAFEDSVNKINPLLQEISATDDEIDKMVYELYELTDEEIKIIEDNLN